VSHLRPGDQVSITSDLTWLTIVDFCWPIALTCGPFAPGEQLCAL